MFLVTLVLSLVLAAVYAASGAGKLTGSAQSLGYRDALHVAPTLWQAIGGLELLGAAGLVIGLALSPLGVLAAIGLVLLMVGAVAFHLRAQDTAHVAIPAALGVVAIVTAVLRASTA